MVPLDRRYWIGGTPQVIEAVGGVAVADASGRRWSHQVV